MTETISPQFVRDRSVCLAYMMSAATALMAAALGPAMPFFKAELHMNYKVAALHFSAWAIGSLIAGFTGDKIFRRIGRAAAPLAGVLLCGPAICGLVLARHPAFSVGSIICMGFLCSVSLQALVSMLADRFGDRRTIFIAEINAIGSFACGVAPLVVSACERLGAGWRTAYLAPAALLALCFLILRSRPADLMQNAKSGTAGGTLPPAYWAYWSLIALSVACEWSMIFWSADFMENIGGMQRTDAAAAVAIFLLAMVIGRMAGGRLSASFHINTLLPASCLLAVSGFVVFWLGHPPPLMMSGLFFTGLGIANIYPLAYSACMAVAPGRTGLAAARMSVGSGLAILTAPSLLGVIADKSSIFTGYGVVGFLLIACLLMACMLKRLSLVPNAC